MAGRVCTPQAAGGNDAALAAATADAERWREHARQLQQDLLETVRVAEKKHAALKARLDDQAAAASAAAAELQQLRKEQVCCLARLVGEVGPGEPEESGSRGMGRDGASGGAPEATTLQRSRAAVAHGWQPSTCTLIGASAGCGRCTTWTVCGCGCTCAGHTGGTQARGQQDAEALRQAHRDLQHELEDARRRLHAAEHQQQRGSRPAEVRGLGQCLGLGWGMVTMRCRQAAAPGARGRHARAIVADAGGGGRSGRRQAGRSTRVCRAGCGEGPPALACIAAIVFLSCRVLMLVGAAGPAGPC